jgi:septal ring-binding cell division protein DamX
MRLVPLLLFVLGFVLGCSSPSRSVDVRAPATETQDRHTDSGWHCRLEEGATSWECEADVRDSSSVASVPAMGVDSTADTSADPSQRQGPALVVPPSLPEEETEPPSDSFEGASSVTEAIIAAHTGDYTIQLVSLDSMEAVQAFAQKHALDDPVIVPVGEENRVRYALLLGFYASEVEAQEAVAALPEELRSLSPWVRTLNSLGEAMARARTLSEASARRSVN